MRKEGPYSNSQVKYSQQRTTHIKEHWEYSVGGMIGSHLCTENGGEVAIWQKITRRTRHASQ